MTQKFFIILLIVSLFSGCASMPDWLQFSSKPTAERNSSSQSLTDATLKRILKKEERFYAQIEHSGAELSDAEKSQKIQDIVAHYQSLLLENPNYVYGFILYGKFLRSIGDPIAANQIFLQANSIDPNVPTVKQHIGLFLMEEGEYGLALPYFLSAIELTPNEAIYHYNLAELLYQFQTQFIESGKFTPEVIEAEMFNAYQQAAELAPENRDLQMRFAESYFDIAQPNWENAIQEWAALEQTYTSEVELDIIRLQKARAMIAAGYQQDAQAILSAIERPSLETSRQQLLNSINL